MRNKLTSFLADTLFVTVGATVIVARKTSDVTKSCVKEGKSFCTEVKTKYNEKKSNEHDYYYDSKSNKYCDSLGIEVE
tara:strand:- start:105 stop:338 length:234 start_codon:yes stop_codon:yes gene_type:complete